MQKCLLDSFDFVFSVEFNFLAKFSPFTSKPRPIILCISLGVIGRSAILLSSDHEVDFNASAIYIVKMRGKTVKFNVK